MTLVVRDVVAGLVLLALSIGYYMAAEAMPRSILDTSVNSAAFPKLLAIGGGLFSIALIVQAAIAGLAARTQAAGRQQAGASPLWSYENKRALGLLLIISLFIVLFDIIGYPLAIVLVILAISRYQGYPLSKMSFAVALGGALFFWLFFVQFLGIRMPAGFWSQLAGISFAVLPA